MENQRLVSYDTYDRRVQLGASRHRYKDAEFLQQSARWNGAIYLAGYAIECSLKMPSRMLCKPPGNSVTEVGNGANCGRPTQKPGSRHSRCSALARKAQLLKKAQHLLLGQPLPLTSCSAFYPVSA